MSSTFKETLETGNPISRNKQISIVVNQAEHSLIVDMAQKSNRNVSEFCRETVINCGGGEFQFKVLCGVLENVNEKVVEILKHVENK